MYCLSQFGQDIWPTMQVSDGQLSFVYGDLAHLLGPGMICTYCKLRNQDKTPGEAQFTKHMSQE